jgi:hypothetical protein
MKKRTLVVLVPILLGLVVGVVFGVEKLREQAQRRNENRTIATLKMIYLAEDELVRKQWQDAGIEVPHTVPLEELARQHLVNEALASGERKGYRYVIAPIGSGAFYLLASPLDGEGYHYFAAPGGTLFRSSTPIHVDPTGKLLPGETAGCGSSHEVYQYPVGPRDAD